MTAFNAKVMAGKYREVAALLDQYAAVQSYVAQCNPDNIGADVHVTWGLGTSVPGYTETVGIVSKMAAHLVPGLIREAERQMARDLERAIAELHAMKVVQ